MTRSANTKTDGTGDRNLWDRYVRWLERVSPGKSARSTKCHASRPKLQEKRNIGGFIIPQRPSSTRTLIDPVCGMNVYAGSTPLFSIYQGTEYYFCCEACRRTFDDCPDKFTSPKSKKPLGVWGRYLKRLEKISGGRPMRCH